MSKAVSTIDIMPTMLDFAGVNMKDNHGGTLHV